ncbi:hypothetical protein ACFV2N_00465 [Streptomyces sp. NPDC059680]|uniref:hypothetical protein n=1 Tax=Streptomyces sp. NPDC059680 TaxID=3346904 RepID=UPI0036B8319B
MPSACLSRPGVRSRDFRDTLRDPQQRSAQRREVGPHRSCDVAEPKVPTRKVGVFERVRRKDGWRVESPYADATALGVRSRR